jgi:DNA (cytosine-5)-methyltransferase 1
MIGSLCTGYGGLDKAVQQVLKDDIAWVADNSEAARKLLAHRYDVPNLGDITKVDWESVPRIDILTAGFPCQPISRAGRGLGTDDERWLWPDVATAIRILRPGIIVLENVADILRRGITDVLGDLSSLGYDAEWQCLRASGIGAPHRRDRWFAVAYPECGEFQQRGIAGVVGGKAAAKPGERHQRERTGYAVVDCSETASHSNGTRLQGSSGEKCPDGKPAERGNETDWGKFSTAIFRWEAVIGRPAPVPVSPGKTRERLNPVFAEWMMGLDEGWVTGVPGLSYREQLHLLGNGVVPRQAAYAIGRMI